MHEPMLWTILGLAVLNVALVAALYQRSVRAGEGAAKEVREELRAGREEARGAGKELREEVSAALKGANEGLTRTLEAMGKGLQAQAEATARGMKEFAQAQGEALERVRGSLDARVKELQEGNEKKLDEVRRESAAGIKAANEALAKTLETQAKGQNERIDAMAKVLKELVETNGAALERMRVALDGRVKELQEGNERKLDGIRKESADGLKAAREEFVRALEAANKAEGEKLDAVAKALRDLGEANGAALEKVRATLDGRMRELQEGNEKRLDAMRQESAAGLKAANETLARTLEAQAKVQGERIDAMAKAQGERLDGLGKAQGERLAEMSKQVRELTAGNEGALERIRALFDLRIKELQEGNERKLDEMKKTVDEKLHVTLEKRLGESFKFVSDRLEAVHKGLGEMQSLATGVGDLKRVLSNVKVRGTWAEVQLGAILEQLLAPGQWERNVAVKEGSAERVEFAVRLPGPKGDPEGRVYLPVDSKFPQEDYLRLQDALERGDADAARDALDAVSRAVKVAAKEIHDKYVAPPATTDFAIMYLATEGLFAEVVRKPELVDELQQRFRVVVAGPTTLAALLSSLRMGFQTLSIEKRAAEVWRVLGAVKTEFGKFGETLEKVKRNLATATKAIDQTGVRSRAMARQLRAVESLPETEAEAVLELPVTGEPPEGDDEA